MPPSPALAPARPFPPQPAASDAAAAAHDLHRVSVGPAPPIQRAEKDDKKEIVPRATHHDPEKNKHLNKGMGAWLKEKSKVQLDLISQGYSRKDANRMARQATKGKPGRKPK